jgi:hypothetical protein
LKPSGDAQLDECSMRHGDGRPFAEATAKGAPCSADVFPMTHVAHEPSVPEARLNDSIAAVRNRVLDLLRDATQLGLARDFAAHEVVARLQRASNDLGEALRSLPEEDSPERHDPIDGMEPAPSRDAAVVLTLALLTVPRGAPAVDKAERWLRILRLHGRVGSALLRLGVPDGPVATIAEPAVNGQENWHTEATVVRWAAELAHSSGATTVDTVHVLFAVREVFGSAFDRALYDRGTTWDQLVRGLAFPSARA